MKICIVQTIHPPFDKRVFHKEAKSLVAAGHEVVSIVPSDEPLPEEVDGVQLRRIPESHSWAQRFLTAFRLIGAGRRERADVYMGVEPESWVSILGIKLITGRKAVFDVHEYFPTLFAKLFPKVIEKPTVAVTRFAMRIMARFTDHLILTKECLDEDFEGLRVPRTVVLNTNHLQPPCTAIPKEVEERYAGKPTIIHQGIFGVERGAYELLEAMKIVSKEIPDIICICLGSYEYGDEAAYLRALEETGMDRYIHMAGVVPFEEVPAYVAVSRVGLILFQPVGLEHTYGMPHKMFDYMREGVPIVAPDYAIEIARVIREADCGLLIDVTDPEAIAEAIVRLLRDPEEAARLGENGRRSVETKYHWEQDEQRLLAVFDSLEDRGS